MAEMQHHPDGPVADVTTAIRRIVDEAIGRFHREASLRDLTALERRAHCLDLAARAAADGEAALSIVFRGLASAVDSDGSDAALAPLPETDPDCRRPREAAARVDNGRPSTDKAALAFPVPISLEETAAASDLLLELALVLSEAGLVRAELLAARWEATGRRMLEGGHKTRGAIVIGTAAALLLQTGPNSSPLLDPRSGPLTCARIVELADDTMARFGLLAANTTMSPAELRAAVLEMAARLQHSGQLTKSQILGVLAATVCAGGDGADGCNRA